MDLELSDNAPESSSSATTTVTTMAEEQEINSPVESHMRRPSPPKQRKSDGVRSWLFELGLSQYATMFESHEIDDRSLPLLTWKDLKDMGIIPLGPRRIIYNEIQKLKKLSP